jgi:hypothetical protein
MSLSPGTGRWTTRHEDSRADDELSQAADKRWPLTLAADERAQAADEHAQAAYVRAAQPSFVRAAQPSFVRAAEPSFVRLHGSI